MKPEWGSRLCARAASCGSTMMRLPSGSVPPSGEAKRIAPERSEEHTSELQSLTNLVCRLLLEKKKKKSRQNRCMHAQHFINNNDAASIYTSTRVARTTKPDLSVDRHEPAHHEIDLRIAWHSVL